MPKPTLTSRIRDFDDFLYAVVREEAGGPALTVRAKTLIRGRQPEGWRDCLGTRLWRSSGRSSPPRGRIS